MIGLFLCVYFVPRKTRKSDDTNTLLPTRLQRLTAPPCAIAQVVHYGAKTLLPSPVGEGIQPSRILMRGVAGSSLLMRTVREKRGRRMRSAWREVRLGTQAGVHLSEGWQRALRSHLGHRSQCLSAHDCHPTCLGSNSHRPPHVCIQYQHKLGRRQHRVFSVLKTSCFPC